MSTKFLFEGGGTLAEKLGGELQDAAGVGDDLHGLDAGDVVEEPAAAGVHEHGVALELHEHEGAGAFFFVELVLGVRAEKSFAGSAGAIEHNADVFVAGSIGDL